MKETKIENCEYLVSVHPKVQQCMTEVQYREYITPKPKSTTTTVIEWVVVCAAIILIIVASRSLFRN